MKQLIVLLTLTLGLYGCFDKKKSSGDAGSGVSDSGKGKTLQYSEDGSPTTMDPVQSATIYANKITTAVYDTLYEYKYLKTPFELKPRLAEGFPTVSKDGMTYTFKLKKGIFFIDDACFPDGKGREVVAADFVYSLKRHFDKKNRSQGSWLWAQKIKGLDEWKDAGSDYTKVIEGLKTTDKHTVQITLKKSFPQLIYTLAMGYSAVMPHEAVKKYGKEITIHPVGSGPFKLLSHNSKKTVLVRNPTFRKETFDVHAEGYEEAKHGKSGIKALHGKSLPIVDRVEVNWMKEPVARWNSFTKGNEIVWSVLQNEQLDEVLSSKNPVTLKPKFDKLYNYRVTREAGLIFNNFNMAHKTFGYSKNKKENDANKNLRCAIRKAIDWPQRINKFYLGIGDAYPGFIPPSVDGYDETLSNESVTMDIAGAKALLKKGGWNSKNLPEFIYPGVSSVRTKQVFEHFRGNLAQIGYPKNKIKFKGYATFGDYNKDVKNARTMMVPMGWGLDYPDAENTLGLFFGPNGSPGSNSSNYDNPAFNKMFVKAGMMQPSPERTALYKKLNKMIVEDCVSISAFSRTRVYMWHKNAKMWPQRDIISNIFKYVDVM